MMRTALLCLFAVAAGHAAGSLQPRQLRCEYRTDPQGVDVADPRLSWLLASASPNARGLRQSAYRILVASSERNLRANTGDLWDTGKVASDESVHVAYHGAPLASGAIAFWKVQVWDQDGAASDWSAPAQWTMGLLDPMQWQGKWIGRDEKGVVKDAGSPYAALEGARWIWDADKADAGAPAGDRFFRAAFTLPPGRAVASATLIAGADNQADVYCNGVLVASASNARLPAISDVAAMAHSGENLIAVRAAHRNAGRPAGLIATLLIRFESGEPLVVQTGNQWRVTSKVEDGWEKAGYLDASWAAAKELGAYGMAPWSGAGFTAEHRLPGRLLRREFTLSKKVARAAVYYSGLGSSELYLNGEKVGDHVLSPGLTDYDKHVLYETFDVTKQLTTGRNAIGLMLGNGRYYAPRGAAIPINTRSFGFPKAIVQLNILFEDGTRTTVESDENWKLTVDGPVRANNEYDGEEYDARMEIAGWSRAGFDDSKWEPAQAVAAPKGVLASQMAEPLRVTETLKPVSVKRLRPGVYIFDMAQNMVGWCRLHVAGPKGAAVTLRHAETLNADGSLYVANLRSARAADTYILKGEGREVWEPRFTYHGFRYVEVTGYPGEPTAAALEGRVVHDDMEPAGSFVSSSALLNQIHHNMFWGIRGNYRSIPTDCPQRDERQGWLGDRSQVSRSESYMFDVAAFYSKWETDLVDAQRADGAIPDVAPNYWPIYSDNLTWPGTLVFVPGMLYDQYGEKRVLARAYPAMKKWIGHMRTYLRDGLIPKDTYADWCVPPEDPKLIHSQDPARITDKTLIASAYYYKLLHVLARYANILDNPTEAATFEMQASAVKQAFLAKFYKPASGIFDNGTQTASILPLSFGLVPVEDRAAVLDGLTRRIEQETHGHVGTGLVGAQWLMRTLSDNGRADLAYQIATQKSYPGWGYMAEKGATTVWELWNGDTADPAMNSGNHVMQIGDLAVWMYEYLAGIRADAERPGFRHTIIHPYPAGDLTSVRGAHKSMYGPIVSSWNRAGGAFTLEVTIPPNTTATVWVPARDVKAVNAPTGARFVRSEGANAIYDIGSGSYTFRTRE
jgi:alpha-L-rhamnosidase